jgi:hypothetical protein
MMRGSGSILRDQRGVALAMALLALVILAALVVAFSVLSATEPTIANNQLRAAQARALAEAGLERALWALTAGMEASPPGGAITGMPAPAPYNGSQFVTVSQGGAQLGGFRVWVQDLTPPQQWRRRVDAVGWVPSDTTPAGQGRAHRRVRADVFNFRFEGLDAPCALCVRGNVQVSGNTHIDSRNDGTCGDRTGVLTTGFVDVGSGAADVYGRDGNNTRNQRGPAPPADIVENFSTALFDQYSFYPPTGNPGAPYDPARLDALKAIARANGTYYQGSVTFNAGNPLPDGIIFIDTTTGQNIDATGAGTTPIGEMASVAIHGNAPPSGTFRGWIVVNGSVSIMGNFQMQGLVYAVNDLTYNGTGTGQISGQVVTQNIRFTSSTTIDTSSSGNSDIAYNCNDARTGGGFVPQSWRVLAGTWKELEGTGP